MALLVLLLLVLLLLVLLLLLLLLSPALGSAAEAEFAPLPGRGELSASLDDTCTHGSGLSAPLT